MMYCLPAASEARLGESTLGNSDLCVHGRWLYASLYCASQISPSLLVFLMYDNRLCCQYPMIAYCLVVKTQIWFFVQ